MLRLYLRIISADVYIPLKLLLRLYLGPSSTEPPEISRSPISEVVRGIRSQVTRRPAKTDPRSNSRGLQGHVSANETVSKSKYVPTSEVIRDTRKDPWVACYRSECLDSEPSQKHTQIAPEHTKAYHYQLQLYPLPLTHLIPVRTIPLSTTVILYL